MRFVRFSGAPSPHDARLALEATLCTRGNSEGNCASVCGWRPALQRGRLSRGLHQVQKHLHRREFLTEVVVDALVDRATGTHENGLGALRLSGTRDAGIEL